jgi:hypothetical protein
LFFQRSNLDRVFTIFLTLTLSTTTNREPFFQTYRMISRFDIHTQISYAHRHNPNPVISIIWIVNSCDYHMLRYAQQQIPRP